VLQYLLIILCIEWLRFGKIWRTINEFCETRRNVSVDVVWWSIDRSVIQPVTQSGCHSKHTLASYVAIKSEPHKKAVPEWKRLKKKVELNFFVRNLLSMFREPVVIVATGDTRGLCSVYRVGQKMAPFIVRVITQY